MSLIVTKFGGSSLADAGQFKKVAEIVKADPKRRYVIASAPGKRFSEDRKVTDMLYACYDLAAEGENFDREFDEIKARFYGIIEDLNLDLNLESEFARIKSGFENSVGSDYAASRGEYLNSMILAKYLGFDFEDAGKLVRFHEDGSFDAELTNQKIAEHLANHTYAVIPGFYGKMPNDTIKTFTRGGSDVTGALVARGVGADIYENWTDVSGFLIADPRIVENPRVIETITYSELRELSYMGATVLHEDAIFPVRAAGIPINIRNTNDITSKGTMIVSAADKDTDTHITGIAGKKGFSIILIEKAMMNQELGFGRKVLEVLEDFKISWEHLPSGIDTMSVVLNTQTVNGREEEIVRAIKSAVMPDSVEIQNGLALIAVVGRGMIRSKGTASKVFDAAAKANVNIRMIDQGSSELNIIIGVDETEFDQAMNAIYREFY